jgi:hypothetical protein
MNATLTRFLIPIAAMCAALSALCAQADRIVHSTQPGAYPTLQAAIFAAVPGDRVLLAEDVHSLTTIYIDKPLQIASAPGPKRTISFIAGPNSADRLFDISGIGAGSRLSFINVNLHISSMLWRSVAIRTSTPQTGDVHFDGVNIYDVTGWYIGHLVDVTVGSLWLRNCNWTANDQQQDGACFDRVTYGPAGGILRVTAAQLILEDTTLRAASGAWYYSHSTNCFGCDGMPYTANTPQGGFALHAITSDTFLIRTRTSDGNGGGAQPAQPPCGSYGIPSGPGQSTFGSNVHAYDFVHQSGLPGAVTASWAGFDAPRGALTSIGDPTAPLRLSGNAQLGGGIQASVTETGISLLAMAFAWSPTNTPVGRIAFDPLQEHFTFLVFTPTPPSTQSWSVPNDPFLSGLPIVTQLFPFDPTNGAWRAANPSALTLRRP